MSDIGLLLLNNKLTACKSHLWKHPLKDQKRSQSSSIAATSMIKTGENGEVAHSGIGMIDLKKDKNLLLRHYHCKWYSQHP